MEYTCWTKPLQLIPGNANGCHAGSFILDLEKLQVV